MKFFKTAMKKSIRQKKTDLFFRAWTGKGFAVFNSIKRVVKICVLPLVYSILVYSRPLFAQQDTVYMPQELNVEEVEIFGQRSTGVFSDIARVIVVITKDELEHAPVQTINDLIDFMPYEDLH